MAYEVVLRGRKGGPFVYSSQWASPMFIRPIAYQSGFFLEVYSVTTVDDRVVTADFTHIERSNQLARNFNPARLR